MPKTDCYGSYDRFSEENFRKMELYIDRCITSARQAKPTVLSHPSLEAITVVRRIRDAIRTFCNSSWDSHYFSPIHCLETFAFLRAGGQYHFSTLNTRDKVFFGTRQDLKNGNLLGQEVAQLTLHEDTFEWREREVIEAILLLKNLNHIKQPITVLGELDPEQLETEYPNIVVLEEGSNIYTIT